MSAISANAPKVLAPPTGFTCLHYVVENQGETPLTDVKVVIKYPVDGAAEVTPTSEHGALIENRSKDATRVELTVQKDSKDTILHPDKRFGVTLVAAKQNWRPAKVELVLNGDPQDFPTPEKGTDNVFVLNVPPSRRGELYRFWLFPRFWIIQTIVVALLACVHFCFRSTSNRTLVLPPPIAPKDTPWGQEQIKEAKRLNTELVALQDRENSARAKCEEKLRDAQLAGEKATAAAQKVMAFAQGKVEKADAERQDLLRTFQMERDKLLDEHTKYVCETLCRSGRLNYKHSDRLHKVLAEVQQAEKSDATVQRRPRANPDRNLK